MDSASSAMICPSYASVSGPFYSSSHPFGSSKIAKSTCQYNAMRYLYKVGRAEIHCSDCREKKDTYPSLPTLKSSAISSLSHIESQRFKVYASRNPKGFGPPPAKRTKKKKRMLEDEEDEEEEQEPEDAVIPEIVTNRMIKRMVASVGLPLAIGLTFFPLFYYMKVVLKWSVPDWLPFITSFFTFGSAALGITYGIMSTSWDPLREGSFLGWTEAWMNWPVFLEVRMEKGKEIDYINS
uniref:TSA: Wollemia nobilis Ref_Wollemi_Transcript_10381_935 transcribed RNA sequence n=1 Tax=Wollemia nobilis TaxID=56998 RepID=A0A0C9QTL6_9CONI